MAFRMPRVAGDELDLQVADGEDGWGHENSLPQLRVQRIAQPVAQQVDRQAEDNDCQRLSSSADREKQNRAHHGSEGSLRIERIAQPVAD